MGAPQLISVSPRGSGENKPPQNPFHQSCKGKPPQTSSPPKPSTPPRVLPFSMTPLSPAHTKVKRYRGPGEPSTSVALTQGRSLLSPHCTRRCSPHWCYLQGYRPGVVLKGFYTSAPIMCPSPKGPPKAPLDCQRRHHDSSPFLPPFSGYPHHWPSP
jgi:hypothetical protein